MTTEGTAVSQRSTKGAIFQAYKEALARIKEIQREDRQAGKKREEEGAVVAAADQHSVEGIVKNLADLKLSISHSMDSLGEKLVAEYKRFKNMQQAIAVSEKNLEGVHEIEAGADALEALLYAQKQKKEEFEDDRAEIESDWKKRQEAHEATRKEFEALLKKERQRNEEEYDYNLKLQRKKDTDTYEEKKAALDKELKGKRVALESEFAGREARIEEREDEYAELKSKVESFPKELDVQIKQAESALQKKIEVRFKYEAELSSREMASEMKLRQQMIAALEAKIKEQDALISQLTKKTDAAGDQVQSIALKAIEGAASQGVGFQRSLLAGNGPREKSSN